MDSSRILRLSVHILKATDLPLSKDSIALPDAYALVKLGDQKRRTKTVRRNPNPVWNEEFVFAIDAANNESVDFEELLFEVWASYSGEGEEEPHHLGDVNVPIGAVIAEEVQSLPLTWFSLQPVDDISQHKNCGKILLSISLYGGQNNLLLPHSTMPNSTVVRQLEEPGASNILRCTDCSPMKSMDVSSPVAEETESKKKMINKTEEVSSDGPRHSDFSELSDTLSTDDRKTAENSLPTSFESAMGSMQTSDEAEMPETLHGGILLQGTYVAQPKEMNRLLFEPNSKFRRDLAEHQESADYHEGAWTWKDTDKRQLTRYVSYVRPPTKIIKAVKATEEQIYLKADGKNFVVLVHVSTPDVPYGNCFQIDLLYKIMPASQSSSGEESSHIEISWDINFNQSTIMKSVIEKNAQQGLKESFESFADLLAQYIKPANTADLNLDKDQLLAPLLVEHQSAWELAIEYLCNFSVVITIFMGLYFLVHILLSVPGRMQGLEFTGLDLPDTFGELITSGILVLQGERVFKMISHFVKARVQRGSDHGVKAQGEGWLVTVALIAGSNFPALASSGFSDPYVVFSCNGQTRTSSVQLQTRDPLWNEVLEFDAMQEPPSVLEAKVFDFDGPFDEAICLGHVEINFVKHTAEELADMWVPLDGKLAQTFHSKLHLKVFLDNTKGSEAIRKFLNKMEREVGKKLSLQSPHRNSTFQRIFGLPPDEYLINDYSCYLKRKFPLQGRLFLSARVVGFHANFFGHKTSFFFLWEDIEDIQVISPSLSTVGTPALLFILRSGRGHDAKHGAKSQDREGRLRFQFQSFASFSSMSRTIMALWRTRTQYAEENAKLEEDSHHQRGLIVKQEDDNQDQSESPRSVDDSEYVLGFDDARLSKAFSAELPINLTLLMEIFNGGQLEKKILEKVGCLNYSATEWEAVRFDSIYDRHITYKFNRHISIFGGEVSSTQRKTQSSEQNGWIVDEVMTLHNVPFGDHFRVYLKYILAERCISDSIASHCDVFVGVKWMKSIKFKKRITRNICNKLTHRSKEIFELVEKEISCSPKS